MTFYLYFKAFVVEIKFIKIKKKNHDTNGLMLDRKFVMVNGTSSYCKLLIYIYT